MKRNRSSSPEVVVSKTSIQMERDNELEQLIHERRIEKLNKTRERLGQDLDRIRYRCPGMPNQAFPPDAFDRLNQNELWEKILGNLTEPPDVTSAFFTCHAFNAIMDDRRKSIMFPIALDVTREWTEEELVRDRSRGKTLLLERKEVLLNARTACREFKTNAEFQLFDAAYKKPDWYVDQEIEDILEQPLQNACVLMTEHSIDRAMAVLKNSATDEDPAPFVRQLYVFCNFQQSLEQARGFYDKILQFLRVYGKSVFSFYFRWNFELQMPERYNRLCDMLECMPNLKGLGLWWYFGGNHQEERPRPIPDARRFPQLSSLKMLYFATAMDEVFLSEIISACTNLKSVLYSHTEHILSDATCQNLLNLNLERYEGPCALILSHYPNVSWPLKRLQLNGAFDSVTLFPQLNKFHGTLESLYIWGQIKKSDDSNVQLDLPKLRSFYFMCFIGTSTVGIDHLLPLKSLEAISVWLVEVEDEDAKIKVKEYFDSNEMHKSNIWDFFPNLKRVQILVRNFYRPDTTNSAKV